jgi:hypothetical protein
MLPMPFASTSRSSGLLRLSAGLLAALFAAVPGAASADTGAPSPQGYTGDVTVTPQQPAQADANDEYQDTDPSALTDFREPLQNYGTWTEDPTYGTIWVPDSAQVGADFAPYQTSGHWATDDNGEWMWVSDYEWGYIPFHYGRWVWVGSRWGWIPGRVYAPAWVTWRVGDDGYLGWAPLPPTYYWSGGYAVGLWTVPYAAYCFVPTSYVFYGNVSTYVVRDRGTVQRIAANTRPYRPAQPSIAHGGLGGHALRRSPTLAEARIPASAAPRSATPRDARAAGFATRSATAATRRSFAATNNAGAFRSPGASRAAPAANAWHSSYQTWNRAQPAPGGHPQSFSPPASAGRAAPPSFHGGSPSSHAPSFHTPRYTPPAGGSTPHFTPPASSPRFSPPAGGSSFHPPSVSHSSPSVSRPSAPRVGGGSRGRR